MQRNLSNMSISIVTSQVDLRKVAWKILGMKKNVSDIVAFFDVLRYFSILGGYCEVYCSPCETCFNGECD